MHVAHAGVYRAFSTILASLIRHKQIFYQATQYSCKKMKFVMSVNDCDKRTDPEAS
jgi:hypothetical protein